MSEKVITLRCLTVNDWSHFFVGNICKVLFMDMESATMVVLNADGKKRVSKFRFTIEKDIKFEGNTFRLRCPPT